MKVERRKLSDLKPAPYNPRKDLQPGDDEYEKLKSSLLEFGYVEPVILNARTGYVVGGHQRLKVLRELGEEEIDCVIVDLDDGKEKALNIALNKISGTWDEDKLNALLNDLKNSEIDLTLTGFDFEDVDKALKDFSDDEEENDYEFKEYREKTYNLYRLYEYDETRTAGYYQFPTLKACHYIPDDLIGFDNITTPEVIPPNCGVHFYIDDYKLERLWTRPYENIERLRKFSCVLTPDFSVYLDMPRAMRIWNMYRMRLIGQMMQDAGLEVIPNLRCIDLEEAEDFSGAGIEPGGVYAVSTIGLSSNDDKEFEELCKASMLKTVEVLKPECIIIYGMKKDYDYLDVPIKYISSRRKNGRWNA